MIKFLRKSQPLYLIVDLFLIFLSFFVPYIMRYNSFSSLSSNFDLPNLAEYCFIFALEVFFIIVAFKDKHLYATDRRLTVFKELSQVIARIFYVAVIIAAIIFAAHFQFFSRIVLCTNFILLCIFLGGWRVAKRLILRKLIKEGFRNINVLIIGTGDTANIVIEELKKLSYWGFNIVGFLDDNEGDVKNTIPLLGKLSDFPKVVQQYFIEEVVVTIPLDKETFSGLIKEARKMRLGVRVVPDRMEDIWQVIDLNYIGSIPFFSFKERTFHPSEAAIKRGFDLIVSLTLLLILSPFFLIIAILIKIDSDGPVFFLQDRVGVKAKPFHFYKFRSMIKGADKLKQSLSGQNEIKDGVIFKMKKDPRITKIGGFLRKYSLDELPQLFNVLRGDMSLVGPRPALPGEIKEYDSSHMSRMTIKPGITGLSQIRGRSDLTFSRWVRWDIWYIDNWSFWLDIVILLRTIPVVLKGKGAY